MKHNNRKSLLFGLQSFSMLALLTCALVYAGDDECLATGTFGFVCGLQNPEDLVLVPETDWIIASGMAPGASIYLIDTQKKTWGDLYPGDAPLARQDMETYGACPGSPDPNAFVTHGLNVRPGNDGHSTLYVVGHGGREAIEVFDIDATGESPVLTWTGCVMLPEGMVANSVTSLSDGSLLTTVPLFTDRTIAEAMAQKNTGAVFAWSPGDPGFVPVEGTGLPYGNGIEVSADGQEFYVASSGLFTVTAFSNTNPARVLRTTSTLAFVPDNIHMGPDGQLLTAGLIADDSTCGNVRGPDEFDLEAFAACPRPFIVQSIDPETMSGKAVLRGPANDRFSNITMGLLVGEEIWMGTFAGDRVAYTAVQ
ncbi:MAG: hypothetical protein KJN69_07700 [Gammaproteobacteria bacterium]|nr:hypothetical protein [Gammaproteobacteria bacterium]